jgi:hypothetical protein
MLALEPAALEPIALQPIYFAELVKEHVFYNENLPHGEQKIVTGHLRSMVCVCVTSLDTCISVPGYMVQKRPTDE